MTKLKRIPHAQSSVRDKLLSSWDRKWRPSDSIVSQICHNIWTISSNQMFRTTGIMSLMVKEMNYSTKLTSWVVVYAILSWVSEIVWLAVCVEDSTHFAEVCCLWQAVFATFPEATMQIKNVEALKTWLTARLESVWVYTYITFTKILKIAQVYKRNFDNLIDWLFSVTHCH